MSKQWQATTRGGHQYRITAIDPESGKPRVGEVTDDGLIIRVTWFSDGKCNLHNEHDYDLLPIEPEAPSPAKARVDLALAAHSLRAATVDFRRAEDARDKAGEAMFNAFVASGKTQVVVKIDGEHYYFSTRETRVFFRKIEVL
jgi:hypothetical protein